MSQLKKLPNFHSSQLLETALTHRSYANEQTAVKRHNERLEFLGDAVLNFLSGEFLYKRFPHLSEGKLTPMRAALVDEKQLAKFALLLDLGRYLRLGKGAEKEGGRSNPNLLSSTFEAIIGAYFLDCDSDMDTVREFVEPFFTSVVAQLEIAAPAINYKSRFQEWALATKGENPKYVIDKASGPDHAKHFEVHVEVCGNPYGKGSGRRKQDAEKDAARDALDRLGIIIIPN